MPDSNIPPNNDDFIRSVHERLTEVTDPELHASIVELGMVGDITATSDTLEIEIALTIAGCPLKEQIRGDVTRALSDLAETRQIQVKTKVLSPIEKARLMEKARILNQKRVNTTISTHTKVFAVASGKGGVGKSSVAVNLALSLCSSGKKVGLLDADIWGFSIPELLGTHGELRAKNGKMEPVEIPAGSGLLQVVSMGFLANSKEAIMWRGLILSRALQHFLEDVNWLQSLDYLIIDLPPGTGDIQMALARMLPETELLLVTTPSSYVEQIASRAADMAKKSHIRIFGVIENMTSFRCEHSVEYPIFGQGGGKRLAEFLHVPLLASIPIDPRIHKNPHEQQGNPAGGGTEKAFADLSDAIVKMSVSQDKMAGCSARMLEAIEHSLEN